LEVLLLWMYNSPRETPFAEPVVRLSREGNRTPTSDLEWVRKIPNVLEGNRQFPALEPA
jgi:hypothetical protein